ncbi:Myeloid differentiation primary response protein MyD88 [Halotydeus destructor]|nr:Myeloid differentiation primary response protein MyD88 [Halotydeus destructor]
MDHPDMVHMPLRALGISSRSFLSQSLNPEQILMTFKGLPRDHRGLAELIGLSYAELKNYQRDVDPTKVLLEAMGVSTVQRTFGDLMMMLEQLERFDVVEDIKPLLLNDYKVYNERKTQIKNGTNTVVSVLEPPLTQESSALYTIEDAVNGGVTLYDAYVCYAEADRDFVTKLAEFLESSAIGLKLLIKDRDLLSGSMEHDAIMNLIERRCRKFLIILSPEFLESPECEFQTRFATGLAIEQRCRKLIPVIFKECNLPPMIRLLSKIDLSKNDKTSAGWSWNKLILSIKGPSSAPGRPELSAKQLAVTYALPSTSNSIDEMLKELPSAPLSIQTTSGLDSLPTYSACARSFSPPESGSNLTAKQSAKAESKTKSWFKSVKQKLTKSSCDQSQF